MRASRSFAAIRIKRRALRYDGFHAAMTAAGLTIDPALIQQGYFTYRSGLEATETLLHARTRRQLFSLATTTWPLRRSRSPTAVVWTCRATSPSSVSTTLLLRRRWPELTTVRQPIAAMAGSAVELLLRSIRQRKDGDARVVSDHVMAHVLIKRDSVAAPCKG